MKTKQLTAILFSATTLLLSQSADAQQTEQVVTKNIIKENRSSNFMAVSDFSLEGLSEAREVKKENISSRSLYGQSEQFVFDNLTALKKKFTIGDIYFDLDQSEIRPDAKPVLDGIANMMMENPEVIVAANSFTDSRVGAYNQKMSQARAQAAIDYLVAKGIGADRLIVEKHGRPAQANPCNGDPSCTLATQQLNRRTEFNVVYNGINLGQTN